MLLTVLDMSQFQRLENLCNFYSYTLYNHYLNAFIQVFSPIQTLNGKMTGIK